MHWNTFKIAIRTLKKNQLYTFINILGLTVGIAAVLLIFRMVSYELSFNKNFKDYDKIVRIVSVDPKAEDGDSEGYCLPLPAMELIKTDVSQFEAGARIHETWSNITVLNPAGGVPLKKFNVEEGNTAMFVDGSFLEVFDFELLAGDRTTALAEPNTIILTQTWAEKCFDNWKNAVGQTVLIDNLVEVKVTAVAADLPNNCDFAFPYLVSYQTVEKNADLFFYSGSWGNCSSNNQFYARLKDVSQWEAANEVLAGIGAKEYTDENDVQRRVHHIQPLSDLHYNENYGHSGNHIISKDRLQVLGLIGLLILIIACFNFINLATAQATLRAKEVGVRKTLGSRPLDLIGQFMTETGLIVLIAVVLGANLATLASPLLKYVSDVPDGIPFLLDPQVLTFLTITTILVTLLSGIYPALKLSQYQPVEALKSNSTRDSGGLSLRKGLVVAQFVIAQALIIGAIITINQLDYMRSKDLGFAQNFVYTFSFNADEATVNRQTALKQSLLQLPGVETVSFNSDQPLSGNTWFSNFSYSTRPEDAEFDIASKFTDEDYAKTYGLRLLAGEWLTASDTSRNCVVNMTTLRKLGVNNPNEAIGQNIRMGQRKNIPIVGVVEDFHTHSLHQEHQALMMTTRKNYYWEAGVKVKPENAMETIAAIQKTYDNILPEQVFVGRFLDENIERFYEDDARMSATCKGFGLLAILISCLGLFGLATHTANQRIKEIGIRKVLGASIPGIVGLLSKDFLQLVVVALVLAGPLAWMTMSEWLNNFEFRIAIQWQVFLFAGLLAMLIAFLTVSYQAIRAALANPIKALKSE